MRPKTRLQKDNYKHGGWLSTPTYSFCFLPILKSVIQGLTYCTPIKFSSEHQITPFFSNWNLHWVLHSYFALTIPPSWEMDSPLTYREWNHNRLMWRVLTLQVLLRGTQDSTVLFNMAGCNISFIKRTQSAECSCRIEHFTFNLTNQVPTKWDVLLMFSRERPA